MLHQGRRWSSTRVVDAHPDFLRVLASEGMAIGTRARVESRERAAGVIKLAIVEQGRPPSLVSLSFRKGHSIRVSIARGPGAGGQD
ncbi:hypothetical protein NOCA250036 [metagenome]|uniref:Ferrous iron transporter FeoA domain-containing protein n=1 Tax=metagenome TaxID=256318 RepID=A0A2P2C8R7_9ZZZZ